MLPWSLVGLATTFILSYNTVIAELPTYCDGWNYDKVCEKTLDNITVVTPGQFVIAKLQCYNCPTFRWIDLHKGTRAETHEDNALFLNISLSSSRKSLLLNSIPVFPSLPSPPPTIYSAQVPLNYTISALVSSIECTKWPNNNWRNPASMCIADAVGGMGLSYDYAALPAQETEGRRNEWTVQFDPIGGHDGYMVDPYIVFETPQQQVLEVSVRQHAQDKTLEIVEAKLVARERQPNPVPDGSARLSWQAIRKKILRFFERESEDGKLPGHIVYLQYEWDGYGKTGTMSHMLSEIRDWQWLLIGIICGSVFGGVLVLYGMFRLAMFIRRDYTERARRFVRDEEGKFHERERLIDWDEEENLIDLDVIEDERSALLNEDQIEGPALKTRDAKEQSRVTSAESNDKPLFDKPLPSLPPTEED